MSSREHPLGAAGVNDLTAALAGAGSIEDVAGEIVRRGAAIVGAATAHLTVVTRPGWRREFVGGDFGGARGADAEDERPIAVDTPLSRALVTRREQLFERPNAYRDAFPHLAARIDAAGARSAVTTPLRRADGEVFGALTFGFAQSGPILAARRSAAQLVAEQSAVALDRAVLLSRERDAAQRALRLHRASTDLAAVTDVHELAAALQNAGRDSLEADRCFVYALDTDGVLRLVSPTDALSAYPAELPPGAGNPARDAVVLSGAVVVETAQQHEARYGATNWPRESSLFALPLRVGPRTTGALVVSYAHEQRFSASRRGLATGLAEQAALALDRCVLHDRAERQTVLAERERDRLAAITAALQDGLFTSDPHGLILDVNDRFCEITGFPRSVTVGARPPYPWWPDADVDTVRKFIDYMTDHGRRRGDRPSEFEVVFRHPDGKRVRGLLTATVLRDADGTATGAVATVKDVTERVLAERRLRVLYAVTAGLAAARTVDEVARVTVDEAVFALGAAAGAFVRFADAGAPAQVVYTQTVERNALAVDPAVLTTGDLATNALASGEIVTTDALPGTRYAAWIPVSIDATTVACLALGFARQQQPHPDDLALYTALSQQCCQALERALAADAEHRARLVAERSSERTRRLQEATAALSTASEPLDVARVVTAYAVQLVPADGAALFALDAERDELVLVDNGTLRSYESAAEVMRVPLGAPLSPADAARTQTPVWIHDPDEWRARYPHGAATLAGDLAAIGSLPLIADGRTLGVLTIVFRAPLDLDDDERSLLATLADLAGRALQRAGMYAQERAVARTLQQSLLPRTIEVTDRCRIAVRYEPASDQLQVGGDWYDALVLDSERLAVMVGDVVGRGLSAAASMGQLRSALGALAVRSEEPGAVLELLDRFAERIDGGEAATVAFATIDTVCGTMRYACAGHPPPLLVEPGAPVQFLDGGRSWPLGIGHRARRRPDAAVRLRPGSAVVFYTDGLVERRTEDLQTRFTALAAAAGSGPIDDPAALCDRLFDTLLDDEPRDDVAALSLVYDPALAARAEWTFPAEPRSVRDARSLVRRWLARHGVDEASAADITLACDEACTNAVEHGSGGPHDPVSLTLELDAAEGVVVTVTDTGSWRPPAPRDDRGHGLVLMRALMSSVEHSPTDGGTTVRLTRSAAGAA